MVLAAKLAARELEPQIIADDGGVWNMDRIATDEEWIAFAEDLRGMIRRKGLPSPRHPWSKLLPSPIRTPAARRHDPSQRRRLGSRRGANSA